MHLASVKDRKKRNNNRAFVNLTCHINNSTGDDRITVGGWRSHADMAGVEGLLEKVVSMPTPSQSFLLLANLHLN